MGYHMGLELRRQQLNRAGVINILIQSRTVINSGEKKKTPIKPAKVSSIIEALR